MRIIEKYHENPELVIDILRQERAVFTRDEIGFLLKKHMNLDDNEPLKYIDCLNE
ncbi:MAG UNVERIFIED_CONTAM: hypothetical protein LVQ98_03540 [Rickettsiaceae bacterium]|jgi:hypothetical protein